MCPHLPRTRGALLTPETTRLIGAQLAGGLAITVVACLPLLLMQGSDAVLV